MAAAARLRTGPGDRAGTAPPGPAGPGGDAAPAQRDPGPGAGGRRDHHLRDAAATGLRAADGAGPVLLRAARPAAAMVQRARLLDGGRNPRTGLPVPRGPASGAGPARLIPRTPRSPPRP